MSDSVGMERFPNILEDTGGVADLSRSAAGLPVLSGGAGGLPALSRGEAELMAQVVTMDNSIRAQEWSCKQ